ncbi:MAG: Gfo/Idh/MocA family oxidoreductase [Planctomycetes bacterium]|nr:Gfo/Idh/MocA family oxidoreductase [Planctomycetota bacterium]
MRQRTTRREFLRSSAAGISAATLGCAAGPGLRFPDRLRVLSIGVIGTIGGQDRKQIAGHPDAEIVGLCDVDQGQLDKAAAEHPEAFTCRDYRRAFADHAADFDAVIVSVPDHSHAPIMLTAMAYDKHIYGQKPLVHQLEELVMMERALAARPHLVTQLGNQRMVYPGRRAAVEILRQGQLGRAIEAHCWTGSPNRGNYFNYDRVLHEPSAPPEQLDWDLWLGPCAEAPFRKDLAPVKWRSWWQYGGNGLADWGCHILDVILFAYDELTSPIAVQTHCAEAAGEHFHVHPCQSKITYAVDSDRFARKSFTIHYNDHGQQPSRAALGLPADAWLDDNCTLVVCEGGTMVLAAGGRLEIWRDGVMTKGLEMPNLPEFAELNHWHAWVDNCLGKKTELRTPFRDAVRITEPALLAVRATRFPGVELRWDKSKLAFTNHDEATQTIVRRDYRDGFAPPRVG